MGCGDHCCAFLGIGFFFGISLVLQGAGFYSSEWATIVVSHTNNTNTSLDCHLGLLISDCYNYAQEPNKAVLGLQAAAFSFILFTNIACIIYVLCCDDCDDNSYCLGCMIVLYPIAGLLILIGCIISATEFSTSQFGWGFYCCMAAGCYIIIETLCMCCVLCITKDKESPQPAPGNSNNDRSVAVPQYSHGRSVAVHQYSHDRSVAVPQYSRNDVAVDDDDSDDDDNGNVVAVTHSSRQLQMNFGGNIQMAAQETVAVASGNGFSYMMHRVTRMVHLRSSVLMD